MYLYTKRVASVIIAKSRTGGRKARAHGAGDWVASNGPITSFLLRPQTEAGKPHAEVYRLDQIKTNKKKKDGKENLGPSGYCYTSEGPAVSFTRSGIQQFAWSAGDMRRPY